MIQNWRYNKDIANHKSWHMTDTTGIMGFNGILVILPYQPLQFDSLFWNITMFDRQLSRMGYFHSYVNFQRVMIFNGYIYNSGNNSGI